MGEDQRYPLEDLGEVLKALGNTMKNHNVKVGVSRGPRTTLMTPAEARHEKKKWKKPLYKVPVMEWTTVPQKLPYRKGDPEKGEEPARVYYDTDFLEMVGKMIFE